jgi:hypothetical protein
LSVVTVDFGSLSTAWRQVGADLGLDVTAPFTLDEDGTACVAWIAQFGSPQGVVIVGLSAGSEVRDLARSGDRYVSVVNEEAYRRYDRDLFVETLNDWGWHGDPARAPDWYTGEPGG